MTYRTITPIEAFNDNYIWCLHSDRAAVVVDPGDAAPVMRFLNANKLELTAILITHHHPDHVGGVAALLEAFPGIKVIGPGSACPQINQPVVDESSVEAAAVNFSVIAVPGHTLDHIAFYCPDFHGQPILFCGDTLFAGGCGRIFEGTPPQMLASLTRLAQLPTNTTVYCAHEYTLANLRFALLAEPGNRALQSRFENAEQLRGEGHPTVPSTLALELETNPFLRASSPEIQTKVASLAGLSDFDDVQIFTELREWKNRS